MKRIITAAMFTLLVLPSLASAADIKPYVGLGIGAYSIDPGGNVGSKTAFGGYGAVGVGFEKYFGAELRLGTSSKTNWSSGGANAETSIDYVFSYLAKVQAPVNDSFHIYGLLGGSTAQVTSTIKTPGFVFVSTGTNSSVTKNTSFTFGGGFDVQVIDDLSVGAEYMRYYSDVNGFTANLKYSF